jgi:hypothetical protein
MLKVAAITSAIPMNTGLIMRISIPPIFINRAEYNATATGTADFRKIAAGIRYETMLFLCENATALGKTLAWPEPKR